MVDINEIEYGDYVLYQGRPFLVFECSDKHSAGLLPTDLPELSSASEDELSTHTIRCFYRQLDRVTPVKAEKTVMRRLFRLETSPWKLVNEGLYPFDSAGGKFNVTEDDLLTFLQNLEKCRSDLLLYAWKDNFSRSADTLYADYPDAEGPGFSLGFFCNRVLDLMEWLESMSEDWQYILDLRDAYLKSKGLPLAETVIPTDFMGDLLSNIERYAKQNPVTPEIQDYYIELMEKACKAGNPYELRRKGYAYYGGNSIVPCDWQKSADALLQYYECTEDPWAANSLGYIYGSDRLGKPDYEKAFYYFSFAADFNITEATYKLSDLYRKGLGTERNPDVAWGLLSTLYRYSDKKHKARGKYADIVLRMGYCYRDGIGVPKDPEQAMKFFREAKESIELRIRTHKGFGDETVLKNVLSAIESLKND